MLALAPLPPLAAFQLLVLGSLALTGPLAYLYARRLGAGPVGRSSTGLGFALGPHLVAHLGDTATIVAAPACRCCCSPRRATSPDRGTRSPRRPGSPRRPALVLLAGSAEAARAAALLLVARLALAFLPRLRRRDGTDAPLRSPAPPRRSWPALLLAAPQLLPTLMALRRGGPGGAGAADRRGGAAAGVAGLVVRYVSHSPAPSSPWPRCRCCAACRRCAPLPPRGAGARAVRAAWRAGSWAARWRSPSTWRSRCSPGSRSPRSGAPGTSRAAAGCGRSCSWPRSPRRGALGRDRRSGPAARELAGAGRRAGAGADPLLHAGGLRDPVKAHVFLLPLTVSFLLQPLGRRPGAGRPRGGARPGADPRRDRARDGRRGGERLLSLARRWPRARPTWPSPNLPPGQRPATPTATTRWCPRARLGAPSAAWVRPALPRATCSRPTRRLELLGTSLRAGADWSSWPLPTATAWASRSTWWSSRPGRASSRCRSCAPPRCAC